MIGTHYRVVRLLGQGGMSNIYLCEDTHLFGKVWAMKEFTATYADPQEQAAALQHFEREARLLSALSHPNLPTINEYFQFQGRYYLAMEYIDGPDLGKIMAQAQGPLPELEVADWGTQCATVLYYLHCQKPAPIIFRDVKPSNIIILHGLVKLIDFGIARLFTPSKKGDTMRIGSPGYAPPEQYNGQTDPRSDIYALGVTLHQALTGHDPTLSPNPFSIPPVLSLNPQASPELAAIIEKATQLIPEERYQNMLEMKRALRQFLLAKRGERGITTPQLGLTIGASAPLPSAPLPTAPAVPAAPAPAPDSSQRGRTSVVSAPPPLPTPAPTPLAAAPAAPAYQPPLIVAVEEEELPTYRWSQRLRAWTAAALAWAFLGAGGLLVSGLWNPQLPNPWPLDSASARWQAALIPESAPHDWDSWATAYRYQPHILALQAQLERALEAEPDNLELALLLGNVRAQLQSAGRQLAAGSQPFTEVKRQPIRPAQSIALLLPADPRQARPYLVGALAVQRSLSQTGAEGEAWSFNPILSANPLSAQRALTSPLNISSPLPAGASWSNPQLNSQTVISAQMSWEALASGSALPKPQNYTLLERDLPTWREFWQATLRHASPGPYYLPLESARALGLPEKLSLQPPPGVQVIAKAPPGSKGRLLLAPSLLQKKEWAQAPARAVTLLVAHPQELAQLRLPSAWRQAKVDCEAWLLAPYATPGGWWEQVGSAYPWKEVQLNWVQTYQALSMVDALGLKLRGPLPQGESWSGALARYGAPGARPASYGAQVWQYAAPAQGEGGVWRRLRLSKEKGGV